MHRVDGVGARGGRARVRDEQLVARDRARYSLLSAAAAMDLSQLASSRTRTRSCAGGRKQHTRCQRARTRQAFDFGSSTWHAPRGQAVKFSAESEGCQAVRAR